MMPIRFSTPYIGFQSYTVIRILLSLIACRSHLLNLLNMWFLYVDGLPGFQVNFYNVTVFGLDGPPSETERLRLVLSYYDFEFITITTTSFPYNVGMFCLGFSWLLVWHG